MIELIARGPVPVLVTVIFADLDLFLVTWPKLYDIGETSMSETLPLPRWVTVKVFPSMLRVPVLVDGPVFEATE